MASDLVHRAWLAMESDRDAFKMDPKDPVLYLARAVLAQACQEWRSGRYAHPGGYTPRPPELVRGELQHFFGSPDFAWWCGLADVDPQYVRARNGVEVRCST